MNPFRYVGQYGYYTDVETNDIYIRARSYNPSLGRWLTRDPIGFDGSPWNLYEYVGGRPTVLYDPLGEDWWPWWPWTKCPPKVTEPYVFYPNAGVSASLKWRNAQKQWPNPNKILACKQLVVEIKAAEAAGKTKLAEELKKIYALNCFGGGLP